MFLAEGENKSVFWKTMHKSIFHMYWIMEIISMPYKILFDIIPTNQYLPRVKVSNNSMCNLYEQAEPTTYDPFSECNPVQ